MRLLKITRSGLGNLWISGGLDGAVLRGWLQAADECTWRTLPFPGPAHVAAGQKIRRPRVPGLEACGSMGKIVLFLVSSSSFYGGGGGGLMVAPRLPKIGLDCGREHENLVWGRSGAFRGLVGLPGSPLGRFLVSLGAFRGLLWDGFQRSGETLGSISIILFLIFCPELLPTFENALRFFRRIFFKGVNASALDDFSRLSEVVADTAKRFAVFKDASFSKVSMHRCTRWGGNG